MDGKYIADIKITIVFKYKIDIMEYKAIEIIFFDSFKKADIEKFSSIKNPIAELFNDEDRVIKILSLENRNKIG